MAEVEKKKKKLTKRDFILLGIILSAFAGYGILQFYSIYIQARKAKTQTPPKKVSPAQIPVETVAKAIKEPEVKAKSSKLPPIPPPKKKPTEEKIKRESEKPEKEEWKLPKPSGGLKVLPKEERKRFTIGLPKPSLFRMNELREVKKSRLAEKMKVITPKLVVVEKRRLEEKRKEQIPVNPPKKAYKAVIAAGMFVPAVLSQGIKAPIGYKVPVRFKLTGSASGVGSYSFPLDSCVVLGAGKGVQTGTTARIDVELIKMACVWPDGKIHTIPVSGYTVDGSDGKLHIAASLKENLPQVVKRSFIAGALLGAAEAAQKAQEVTKTTAINQTSSITSQEVKNSAAYTFWGGVAGALSQTQKLIDRSVQELSKLKTADRKPGGKVYLIFTKDVKVPTEWLGSTEKEYDFAGYER